MSVKSKKFVVEMFHLALVPLQGGDIPINANREGFDDLVEARAHFESAKKKGFDRVYLSQRSLEGQLERIETYQKD